MERAEHVAAIVLSYQGREDTLACLESLAASRGPRLTVIVVDNASTDGSPEAVRARFPDVTLIEPGQNLGFAEGNNVGLRHALEIGADHAFLLNNDATVTPETIELLVDEAGRRPRAGALCPLITFSDPPDAVWYAGADYDAALPYNGSQAGYGERPATPLTEPRPVGRMSGAAVLVPRRVLEQVGLLDADLFLHMEDVEWSLRMRAAGLETWLVPRATVVHRVSVASGGEHSPVIAYYAMRNTLAVGDRHGPPGRLRRLARHGATVAVHLAHARRARQRGVNARAVLAGWADYRRGRMGRRDTPLPGRHRPPS